MGTGNQNLEPVMGNYVENRNWELGTRKRELEISNKEKENGLFSSILQQMQRTSYQ